MSRYSSLRELEQVVRDTIEAAGINPRDVYMSRVYTDLKFMGDSYYGWTLKDPGVDPVEVARRHTRKES